MQNQSPAMAKIGTPAESVPNAVAEAFELNVSGKIAFL
jgi:hypothetical protein